MCKKARDYFIAIKAALVNIIIIIKEFPKVSPNELPKFTPDKINIRKIITNFCHHAKSTMPAINIKNIVL